MKKIKYFEEWSVSEGILDIFRKKKKGSDYITLPKWQGKNNIKFTSKRKPHVSNDNVEFYIDNDGIDLIIFHNKTVGDNRVSVVSGNNKHNSKLDQKEADRLRKLYTNKNEKN
jgi:hypothetical protein